MAGSQAVANTILSVSHIENLSPSLFLAPESILGLGDDSGSNVLAMQTDNLSSDPQTHRKCWTQ